MARLRTHNRRAHRRRYPNYSGLKYGYNWFRDKARNIWGKRRSPETKEGGAS